VKLNCRELTEIMSWLGQPATEHTALPWLAERFNLQAICLNKGAAGATFWAHNRFFRSSGFSSATPPETIGSGDAFLAALLAGLLQGRSPGDCLRRACAASALVARQPDALPALAERDITELVGP